MLSNGELEVYAVRPDLLSVWFDSLSGSFRDSGGGKAPCWGVQVEFSRRRVRTATAPLAEDKGQRSRNTRRITKDRLTTGRKESCLFDEGLTKGTSFYEKGTSTT